MIYNRKSSCLLSLAVVAMLFCGCVDRKDQGKEKNASDSVRVVKIDTAPVQNGPNRTLYGVGDEFGMSTFTLIIDNKEEYNVTRVSEAGEEGRIFGTVAPGQHYAMMVGEDGESLHWLINLDELERFVGKDYYIYNGQLVLTLDGNREWVDVEFLSKNEFKAKGKSGKSYSFKNNNK